MRLLNLGCGGCRPKDSRWTNVDNLLTTQFPLGTPERAQIQTELNYFEHDITQPLTWSSEWFDGVMMSHVLEHFPAQQGLKILQEAHRVLVPGGKILISVPDASYFRKVYPEDRNENWQRLFGVTDPKNPIPTWFEAALWFDQHEAIFSEDTLWAYLVRAGFKPNESYVMDEVGLALHEQVNRVQFSLIMQGTK